MKGTNATQEVLSYLKKNKKRGLTQRECTDKFGATRLSAIIFNLKSYGFDIDYVDEYVVTRYGKKTRVRRYFYVGEADD